MTPLAHALDAQQEEVAIYLLRKVAHENVAGEFYHSPLVYAIPKCSVEMVDMLLQRGAKFRNDDYMTPLEYALRWGRTDLMDLFLRNGYRLDYPKRSWCNPLTLAAFLGAPNTIQYLVDKGYPANEPDHTGNYPLSVAALEGRTDVVKELLRLGADPNAVSRGKMHLVGQEAKPHDALLAAVRKNSDEIVELLLEAGADPTRFDHEALKYADLLGNQKIHDLLIAYGAEKQPPFSFLSVTPFQQAYSREWAKRQADNSGSLGEGDWMDMVGDVSSNMDSIPVPAAGLSLAILSNEKGVGPVEDLLLSFLSQESRLEVVERTELQKVVKEHQLPHAGLKTVGVRVQVGELMGADAVIMLTHHENQIEVKLISSSTGLIVDQFYYRVQTDGSPVNLAQNIGERIKKSVGRVTTPLDEAILISLSTLSSTRISFKDKELRSAIAKGLGARLARRKNLFFLERDEMEALYLEKTLTDNQKSFLNSGWILDGTIDYLSTSDEDVRLKVRVRSASQDASTLVSLSGRSDALSELIDRMANHVLKKLEGTTAEAWTSEEEAKAYMEEANRLKHAQEWKNMYATVTAASVLGSKDPKILEYKILALANMLRTSNNSIKDKPKRFGGEDMVLAYRAPLLLPPGPLELSAEEYLTCSEELLSLLRFIVENPNGHDFEKTVIKRFPEYLKLMVSPIRMLQPLSMVDVHQQRLDALIENIHNTTDIFLKKEYKSERAHAYHTILGVYLSVLPYLCPNDESLAEKILKILEEVATLEFPFSKHGVYKVYLSNMDLKSYVASRKDTALFRMPKYFLASNNPDIQYLGYKVKSATSVSPDELHNVFEKSMILMDKLLASDHSLLGTYVSKKRAMLEIWSTPPQENQNNLDRRTFPYSPRTGMNREYWTPPGKFEYTGSSNKRILPEFKLKLRDWWLLKMKAMAETGSATVLKEFPDRFAAEDLDTARSLMEKAQKNIVARIPESPYSDAIRHDVGEKFLKPMNDVLLRSGGEPITILPAVKAGNLERKRRPTKSIQLTSNRTLDPGKFYQPFLTHPNPHFKKKDKHNFRQFVHEVLKTKEGLWIGLYEFGFVLIDLENKEIRKVVHLPTNTGFYENSDWHAQTIDVCNNKLVFQRIDLPDRKLDQLVVVDLETKKWSYYENPIVLREAENKNLVHITSIKLTEKYIYVSYTEGAKHSKDLSSGLVRIHLITGKAETMATSRDLPLKPPFIYEKSGYKPTLYRTSRRELLLHNFLFNEDEGEWTRLKAKQRKSLKKPFNSGFTTRKKGFSISSTGRPFHLISRFGLTKRNGLYTPGIDISIPLDLKEKPKGTGLREWTRILDDLEEFKKVDNRRPNFSVFPGGVILHNSFGFYVIPAAEVIPIVKEALKEFNSLDEHP
jgi:ankyrin repeat protein